MPTDRLPFRTAARHLLALSLPLILSNSFWTLQIFIDRVFIAAVGDDAVAATMPTVGYFWTVMALLNNTVLYVTVFVAQYLGAGRPGRTGPVVWQALWFALAAGLVFPLLAPVVDRVIAATAHSPEVKHLESVYFRSLTFCALPMLVVAAVNGFFAGRGKSWTVLLVNAVGMAVNAGLAYVLIRGNAHDPAAAMHGAGVAAALGSAASAALGLGLLFGRRNRAGFATLSGWRPDPVLFKRFLRYGLPNGVQWMIEGVAFTLFVVLIGNIGQRELAATSLTFSLNMLTFLPCLGLGQGVEVLVGRHQGERNPDRSARYTWVGAQLATGYMAFVAALYCLVPGYMVLPFQAEMDPGVWEKVGPLVPVLLRFVALYSLADGVNIILSYGLRGAGDTRFVVLVAIGLSWPLMVFPTYLAAHFGWGLEAAWGAAVVYISVTAALYAWRFVGGRWRTMSVIEAAVADTDPAGRADPAAVELPKLPV